MEERNLLFGTSKILTDTSSVMHHTMVQPQYTFNGVIIIPCFHEGRIIFHSLSELYNYCKGYSAIQWTIVCVNDGSTDTTQSEIDRFEAQVHTDSSVSFIQVQLEKNEGKGAAIKRGLKEVEADYYFFTDADLSIDFTRAFPDFLLSAPDNNVIIAQRKQASGLDYSGFRKIGSFLFRKIAHILFGLPYGDVQCGFKCFDNQARAIALSVEQNRFSFDLEFLVRARKRGLKIKEVPVSWKHREQSSVGWQDALRYALDVFSITEVAYSRKRWMLIYIVSSILITAVLFGWTLWYGYFFSDDFTWLWHGSKILSGEITILGAHMSSFFSPVLNAFYAFSVALFGLSAWWYFLFGLSIHSMNSIFVGLLTRELTTSHIAGWFAAVLFALTAGAYEPLVWIGANMHSLAVLFMLTSVFCVFRSFDKKNTFAWLTASFLGLVLAFGTKEIAIITPILLVAVAIYRKKFVPSAWYIVYWVGVLGVSIAYAMKQYIAQSQSVWVTGGTLSFSPQFLLRLPVSLFDVFIPLRSILTDKNAVFILRSCMKQA